MSHNTGIASGVVWSIVNNGLSQILSLSVFLITARFVSQESFGVMAICFVIIEFFRLITINNITTALTSKKSPSNEDYNASLIIIIMVSVFSFLTIFFSSSLLARIFDNDQLMEALKATSVLILLAGLSQTHETWLIRNLKFKSLAIRSILSISVGGAVGITMAINNMGLYSLIFQQITISIVSCLFLWGSCEWKPSVKTKFENIKDLIYRARYLTLTGIAGFVNGQSDTFFSAYYLGLHSTGVYNAAKRIVVALNSVITTALGKVALPAFAQIQDNPALIKNAFLKSALYTSLLTAPLHVGIAALSPDLIFILLGEKWMESWPILSILMISSYLLTISQYNYSIFLINDKSQWQTGITVLHAIVNIILFMVVARFGLVALAVAFTLRAVILYPLSAGGALYLLKIPAIEYLRQIMPSILAASLMGVIVYYAGLQIDLHAIARIAVLVPIGIVSYAAIICIMDRKTVTEIIAVGMKIFSKEKN